MNTEQKRNELFQSFIIKVILIVVVAFMNNNSNKIYGETQDTLSMFRGNPQHTGYFGEQGVIDSPKVKWKFKTGGKIFSSPIVYNGVVFIGSGDNYLYAVDENTGTLKWKFKTEKEVTSSPAIYKGTVFFGSMDGYFYALNSDDGSLKWKFQTEGEKYFARLHLFGKPFDTVVRDVFDFFLSSPVIYDGKVYFGSGDGNLYALNIQTGEKIWSFTTGDIVHSSPAVYKGNIYFGSMDRYFYALDGKNGNLLWKYATRKDTVTWTMTGILSSAAVYDSVVYFGCRDANLYALNASNGNRIRQCPNSGSWVLTSPAVFNDIVYYCTSDTRMFQALKIEDFTKAFYAVQSPAYLYSSPSISSDMVYFGCYNGALYSFNKNTGKKNWVFKTDGNKLDIYDVLDDKGAIRPEKLHNDSADAYYKSWDTIQTCGTIVSSPCISKGDVYFGSADGNLYALTEGKATGFGEDHSNRKLDFELNQNYPNPFNPETVISYQIPAKSDVKLKVYDLLGCEVATLINKEQSAGNYNIKFDGSSLASGVYLYKINAGKYSQTRKFVLLK